MKKLLLMLLIATGIFAEDIKVAMAANVGNVLDDLKAEFAKIRPDDKLDVTLGASGKFATQIEQGAPFMVFVSADVGFPVKLKASGSAVSEPKVYASGALALLSVRELDFKKGIAVVANENVEKIAIANPKTAPYGAAAVEAMKNVGVYEKAESKLVQGESITQTYQFAVTAADAGFVALSAVKSGEGLKYKEGADWIEVDSKLYKPIDQAVVLLKGGENSEGAKAFIEFLTGEKAKEIFKKYGYK